MLIPFTKEEELAWEASLPTKMMSASLAICHNDTVLMVKASYKDHWTFPGGIIDEGEAPFGAAIRETFEETGVTILPEACAPLGIIYKTPKDGHRDRFHFSFVTSVETTDLPFTVPNDEIDEVAWVPLTDIAEWAGNRQSYQKLQKILVENLPLQYIEHL